MENSPGGIIERMEEKEKAQQLIDEIQGIASEFEKDGLTPEKLKTLGRQLREKSAELKILINNK